MNQKYLEQRHFSVVKSNELIQKSRFSLTAEQQKLILFLISKIKPTDTDFTDYSFTITEYLAITGNTKGGNTYKDIEEGIKVLADKSMWIYGENGEQYLFRWLQNVRINRQSGIITLRLDEFLKPYLLQLKEKYTQYQLIYTFSLKSKYSIRAYEYFLSMQYDKQKAYTFTISVDEFKNRVGAETYKQFKDLNTRVLKPIEKEINDFTDKRIYIEPKKTGRTTTHLEITVISKDVRERLKLIAELDKKYTGNQISLFDLWEGIGKDNGNKIL